MATINRYTRTQPARFNPMSLQELMVAPAYKRQQHDLVDEAISSTETALAQIDPLDVHNELAKQEQQKLYDQLSNQASQLSAQGFSPSSKSDFLRLNKQYQQAVSPTGTLGRIQSAKKILAQNKQTYVENATKMGYSPEAIQVNWQDHEQDYINKFVEDGVVENIGEKYAPNYFDYIEEGKSLFKDAGLTSSDVSGGSGRIVQDEQGSYVINTQHQDVTDSNINQLQAAVDFINNRIRNENSDAYASIMHQRKTPEQAIQELTGLSDVYLRDKTKEMSRSSIGSYSANKGAKTFNPNLFIDHMIKGIGLKNINPENNILKYGDLLESAQFNPSTGELIQGDGEFATFQDKIDSFKDKGYNVTYNEKTGEYEAMSPYATYNKGGEAPLPFNIGRDAFHLKENLNEIRQQNPQLGSLTDFQLMERLNNYNKNIESEYVSSSTIPGAKYEYMNDRLFGNQTGKGEKGTGIFSDKGATINGVQKDALTVIDELGYKNVKEFKEEGKPTIQGYSIALGKWHVSALNEDGEAVDVFVDDIDGLKESTKYSRKMLEEAFTGKSFGIIEQVDNGTTAYFINDFVEPYLVFGKPGASNASEIQQIGAPIMMNEVVLEEKKGLINNPLYNQLLGLQNE